MSKIEIAGRGGRITVNLLRYERDADADYSDANWLSAEVSADIATFTCRANVSFMTHDFVGMLDKLYEPDTDFGREVPLESERGTVNLVIKLKPKGLVTIAGRIRSELGSNCELSFEIDSDQWFVRKTIEDLIEATRIFPVRGMPD